MGRVKDILIDGYDKSVDNKDLYKIDIHTIDGKVTTIYKNQLDIIDDKYVQHSINGDYISYSEVTQLHKDDQVKQVIVVSQIFLKHIVKIQVCYNCNKFDLK